MLKLNGAFVISLDFEIMWGVRDKKDVQNYYLQNLLGVRKVIPALLNIFTEYDIHATFATVGMLFASGKEELTQYIPATRPEYINTNLSPYGEYLNNIGKDEQSDLLHYAASLIELIKSTPNQEIGGHTFCHYYCLEQGQTVKAFNADTHAACEIARNRGIELKSLVFPRNQFNEAYLNVLKENGFVTFRGNERSWMYQAKNRDNENRFRRAARLLDTYINVSGNNIYSWEELKSPDPLYNIPASRFLRPYQPKMALLDKLRLRRIKNDMTAAAKKGSIYHLWWHPHNFGIHLQENLEFLNSILKHYKKLHQQYQFESLTMLEVAEKLKRYKHAG